MIYYLMAGQDLEEKIDELVWTRVNGEHMLAEKRKLLRVDCFLRFFAARVARRAIKSIAYN